jgi:hypothetical protein
MESKSYNVSLAVSLLEARRALLEHRKWLEGLESSAFSTLEKNKEALTPLRDQDNTSLPGEQDQFHLQKRKADRRSGLISDDHAPKNWKTLFRSHSSKVGQLPSTEIPQNLHDEPNIAIDHQRHSTKNDSKREIVKQTRVRPTRRRVAWQSDPYKIEKGQEAERRMDKSQLHETPRYHQIIVRARETPDIDDQGETNLLVSHTGNHYSKEAETEPEPDGTSSQERTTGVGACISANELPTSKSGLETGMPAKADRHKLLSDSSYMDSNSRGVVYVLPAETQIKPSIGAQTLQTSSKNERSPDSALLSNHQSVNVSVVNSMGKVAMGVMDKSPHFTSAENVKTADVNGSCVGVSIPYEKHKTDSLDETETEHEEGSDNKDSNVDGKHQQYNHLLDRPLSDTSLEAVRNVLDLKPEQQVDNMKGHPWRVETANCQIQDEMTVDSITSRIADSGNEESTIVHHSVNELMSKTDLLPSSGSSQPPVISDELQSTNLAHFTLPFSFDLSRLDEFVLPKSARRSRPPPPYELHRHSKLASHGPPCPPYGIVARSQSTSTESSEAKSPTTVGITGLEAKQLRSKSLSSLEISSTTPTRGSTTDIDDDSVTALHRAARAGNIRQVSLSLENGSNINAQDKDGRTPLMYCLSVKGTHVDCADYLVRSGCDMNKQVVEGKCSHIKKKKKEKTNQNQLQIKDTQLTRDSRRTDK